MSTDQNDSLETTELSWVSPLVRENLSMRAYGAIRLALMRGSLPPGERLPLRQTAERFGVSVTPMREALLCLVSKEALSMDARGTVIVPTLTLDQLMEIRDIRTDLEGRAAHAAATAATAAEIDRLDEIQTAIVDAEDDGRYIDVVTLNTDFHLRLCQMGRLPILLEIVEDLWVRCGPILTHLYDGDEGPDWKPHREVIRGLRNADPDRTRKAIQKDIVCGGKGLVHHILTRDKMAETRKEGS